MKTCNTEIISVGTELLLGHITNTDARDVSEELAKIGINVLYHTVVGDNPGRLASCIEIAKQRADIIITTGGLGPTCDDLTKDMLAHRIPQHLRYGARLCFRKRWKDRNHAAWSAQRMYGNAAGKRYPLSPNKKR